MFSLSLSVGKVTKCYFEDRSLDTNVYLWEELSCEHSIMGPAIIIDKNRYATLLLHVCYKPNGFVFKRTIYFRRREAVESPKVENCAVKFNSERKSGSSGG